MGVTRAAGFIVVIGLGISACGSSSSSLPTESAFAVGDCLSGIIDLEAVPCDDPTASYKLVGEAQYSFADLEADLCEPGQIELDETAVTLEGPLTGGQSTVQTWCAVAL